MTAIKQEDGNYIVKNTFTDTEIEEHRLDGLKRCNDAEEVNPVEPFTVYHSIGMMEMAMHSIERMMDDKVILSRPDYYRQVHQAYQSFFDLQQMMVGDWFDLVEKEKRRRS